MYKIPNAVEGIKVLANCKKFIDANEGDEATTQILLDMTAENLNMSTDKVLEAIEGESDVLSVILDEME